MPLRKWNVVAICESAALLQELVTENKAKVKILAKKHPEYFLRDGEKQELPTVSELVCLVEAMIENTGSSLGGARILKELGLEYRKWKFIGKCAGVMSDDVSARIGSYHSLAGHAQKFVRLDKKVGEEIVFEKNRYLIVVNDFTPSGVTGLINRPHDSHFLRIIRIDQLVDDRQ